MTTTVTEHTLPLPDLNEVADFRNKFSNYSRERLIEYVESFYFKAIESYKKIVGLNFSGLVHKLDFINKLPSEIFVEINRKNPEEWSFRYAFTYHKGKKLSVSVKIDPEQPLFSYRDGSLLVDGVQQEYYQSGGTSLSYMFSPYQGPAYNLEQASFTSAMPIRTFAYENIKEDFKKITVEDLLVELELKRNNLIN